MLHLQVTFDNKVKELILNSELERFLRNTNEWLHLHLSLGRDKPWKCI